MQNQIFLMGNFTCFHLLLVHYEVWSVINYRGDSQVVTVRSTSTYTSWPPKSLNACWALMSSFSRVGQHACFHRHSWRILQGEKMTFLRLKSSFLLYIFHFLSMSRETCFYPEMVALRACWDEPRSLSVLPLHSWQLANVDHLPTLGLFLTEAGRCSLRHTCGSDSRPLWNLMNDHCKLVRGEISFHRREGHQPSSVGLDWKKRWQMQTRSLQHPHIQELICDSFQRSDATSCFLFLEEVPRASWATTLQEWAHFHVHTYWGHPSTVMPGWQGTLEGRLSCWHVRPRRLTHLHKASLKSIPAPVCVCVERGCWKTTVELSFPPLFLPIWRVRSHIKSSVWWCKTVELHFKSARCV